MIVTLKKPVHLLFKHLSGQKSREDGHKIFDTKRHDKGSDESTSTVLSASFSIMFAERGTLSFLLTYFQLQTAKVLAREIKKMMIWGLLLLLVSFHVVRMLV
jgi:hypothetical protein